MRASAACMSIFILFFFSFGSALNPSRMITDHSTAFCCTLTSSSSCCISYPSGGSGFDEGTVFEVGTSLSPLNLRLNFLLQTDAFGPFQFLIHIYPPVAVPVSLANYFWLIHGPFDY